VRPSATAEQLAALQKPGVTTVATDLTDASTATATLAGVNGVVSALQGLRAVIVEAQAALLEAAVRAGVHRFIPSDFASDFTKVLPGENRNFDLRREFHARLDAAPIQATSILNGAFAEILGYDVPFLDFANQRVGYWDDADWRVDFTTMNDVAAFTAAAALDETAPRFLRIASFQVSANELAPIAGEQFHRPFTAVRLGSCAELATRNRARRAAHPEGEHELYPEWQRGQYMHSMFTTQLAPLDNDRYPRLHWTGVKTVLAGIAKRHAANRHE
jgi:uncharacterized protein YbjT (DUF2867 family)